MLKPEEWTRSVPLATQVDGDDFHFIEEETTIVLTPGLTGNVTVATDIVRLLLEQAGYEKRDARG